MSSESEDSTNTKNKESLSVSSADSKEIATLSTFHLVLLIAGGVLLFIIVLVIARRWQVSRANQPYLPYAVKVQVNNKTLSVPKNTNRESMLRKIQNEFLQLKDVQSLLARA